LDWDARRCALAFIADRVAANVISNVVTLWYLFAFAAAASAVVWQVADLTR
jgi:hypothetical protein